MTRTRSSLRIPLLAVYESLDSNAALGGSLDMPHTIRMSKLRRLAGCGLSAFGCVPKVASPCGPRGVAPSTTASPIPPFKQPSSFSCTPLDEVLQSPMKEQDSPQTCSNRICVQRPDALSRVSTPTATTSNMLSTPSASHVACGWNAERADELELRP